LDLWIRYIFLGVIQPNGDEGKLGFDVQAICTKLALVLVSAKGSSDGVWAFQQAPESLANAAAASIQGVDNVAILHDEVP
jgi:hypothetical protein